MFDFSVLTDTETVTVTVHTTADKLAGLLVVLAEQVQVSQEALHEEQRELGIRKEVDSSDVEAVPHCGNCLSQLEPGTTCLDCSEGPDDPDGSDVEEFDDREVFPDGACVSGDTPDCD